MNDYRISKGKDDTLCDTTLILSDVS